MLKFAQIKQKIMDKLALKININKAGDLVHTHLTYHANGKLATKLKLVNGRMQGLSYTYHTNGQIEYKVKTDTSTSFYSGRKNDNGPSSYSSTQKFDSYDCEGKLLHSANNGRMWEELKII